MAKIVKNKKIIPLEEDEQKTFVEWLELKGYMFTAIPNSTYTTSWNQKRKNTAMGLRAGFPDMVILVKDKIVFIELKRQKGGVVSDEQKLWITELSRRGAFALVCYGAGRAIEFIHTVEKL